VGGLEALLARAVTANNARLRQRARDRSDLNPRPAEGAPWRGRLEAAHVAIRAEWDADRARGHELPRIEQVLGEDQGNEGSWQAGLLVAAGKPVAPLADRFPHTMAALAEVPGLTDALWSVLGPGTELPEHQGPNAGVLRLHLGIRCSGDTALSVAGVVVPYRDGETVVFDDTLPHAAWNRGEVERVTLFCQIRRPAGPVTDIANRAVQHLIGLDPRYRQAPERAAGFDHALNG
jgi:hypothetical protein